MDVSESEDPEGLRVFYYLVQDVKVSPSSLISKNLLPDFTPYPVPHLLTHRSPLQNQADIVVENSCPSLCISALYYISTLHQCKAFFWEQKATYSGAWRSILGKLR